MKKNSSPFSHYLINHGNVDRCWVDYPFANIHFPVLDHPCQVDKKTGVKKCRHYRGRIRFCRNYLLKLYPDQPKRAPIEALYLRPGRKGRGTILEWRGPADSLPTILAILARIGIVNAATGAVAHREIEVCANILPKDVSRLVDGLGTLLAFPWSSHVLVPLPLGTLRMDVDAVTVFEGILVQSQIWRGIPAAKVGTIEVVVYSIPKTRGYGYHFKIEFRIKSQKKKPFTKKQRDLLMRRAAGLLLVLLDYTSIQSQPFVGRQHGRYFPFRRVNNKQYGKRRELAIWHAATEVFSAT